jgi:hypothetical protein
MTDLPQIGREVRKGELLVRIQDENLEQELQKLDYDLQQIEAHVAHLVSGGVQGAYRKWLMAEKQRLTASIEKTQQSLSQLDIIAPISGQILEVNEFLRKGAYVHRNSHIMTIGNHKSFEVHAYAEENMYRYFKGKDIRDGDVVFHDVQTPKLVAKFRKVMDFPVTDLPNNSLFDFAGGPIMMATPVAGGSEGNARIMRSTRRIDREAVHPKLAQYPIIFDIPSLDVALHHGTPCSVNIRGDKISGWSLLLDETWKFLSEAGVI